MACDIPTRPDIGPFMLKGKQQLTVLCFLGSKIRIGAYSDELILRAIGIGKTLASEVLKFIDCFESCPFLCTATFDMTPI